MHITTKGHTEYASMYFNCKNAALASAMTVIAILKQYLKQKVFGFQQDVHSYIAIWKKSEAANMKIVVKLPAGYQKVDANERQIDIRQVIHNSERTNLISLICNRITTNEKNRLTKNHITDGRLLMIRKFEDVICNALQLN